MDTEHFTNEQWDVIKPFLPPPARTGRPRADDRRTLEGILFDLRSGCRWKDMPRQYGAPVTAWRRLQTWQKRGVWEELWRIVLSALDAAGEIDWETVYLDGSFAPAKRGAQQSG
jgi:transposase